MNYEQFLEKVKALNVAVSTTRGRYESYFRGKKTEPPAGAFISETWTTGGMTGGNCWGGEADTPVDADREPDFVDFDTILEHFWPEIPHLAYKRFVRELVHFDSHSRGEYYGNYYSEAEKWVDLKEMYDLLNREMDERAGWGS